MSPFFPRGAKIEAKDKDNFTPLLLAASAGHSSTIEILLTKKADITAMDKYEKTAIFWAAEENKPEALNVCIALEPVLILDNFECR